MKLNDLSSLVYEDGNLSLGRLLTINCFLIAFVFWCTGKDIPNNLFSTISALLVYGLGKKAVNSIGT